MDVWNFVDSWCLTVNLSWVKFLFQMNLLHSLRLAPWIDKQLGGSTLRFVSAAAKIDDFTRHLCGHNTPFRWLYRFPMLRKWHVTRTTLPCQSLDSLPRKSSLEQFEWRKNYGNIRTNWYGKIDNNGLSAASEWVPLCLFSRMTPDACCLLRSWYSVDFQITVLGPFCVEKVGVH